MMASKKLLFVVAAVAAMSFLMAGCVEKSTSPSSYKITAEAGTGGTVSFDDPTKTNYAKGDLVTVTAVSDAGYDFAGWEGAPAGQEMENPLVITVEKALTLKATFSEDTRSVLSVQTFPTGAGSVTMNPPGGKYEDGTKVTLKPVPGAGFAKGYWGEEEDGETGDSLVVTVNGNTTIKYTFLPTYALPIEVFPRASVGTADAGLDGGPYVEGTKVNIRAKVKDENYEFYYWELTGTTGATKIVDDASDSTFITIGPDAGLKLVASFRQIKKIPAVQASFEDKREATVKSYDTVQIGNYTWFAKNLNFETAAGSWCYDDDDANCDTYGRLYNWETATAATTCPSGWRLPSRDEWNHLFRVIGDDVTSAHTRLRSENGWGSGRDDIGGRDTYGFAALPGGKREVSGTFSGILDGGAYWWSATPSAGDYPESAHNRYIMSTNIANAMTDDLEGLTTLTSKANGYSVRCLKDAYTAPTTK